MKAAFWRKIKQSTKVWREVILPAAFLIGLAVLVRLTGFLEVQELQAFDDLMRLRISIPPVPRIVIVGIDEDDLKYVGRVPVPDLKLAEMLRILQEYQPRVIGLDLFRDLPVNPGHAELVQAFRDMPNIIGVEVGLNRDETLNVKPPPELPPKRVGFADLIVDPPDGKLRRSLLASRDWHGRLKYSFSLRLAQAYLAAEGITLKHGTSVYDPIEFGRVKVPRLRSNWGGYIGIDARGYQSLLNFCAGCKPFKNIAGCKPFKTISLTEILKKEFEPKDIRDRIVIVGMTAASIKDIFNTAALKSKQVSATSGNELSPKQIIYGVEVHAHATSQIVRAVLDKRPLMNVWADEWEYLWIILWGFLGVTIGLFLQCPWKNILSIGCATLALFIICYLFLFVGLWIPLIPTLLTLSGAGLTTAFFNWELQSLAEQRRLTIKQTYDAVHNGPLQQLAVILRNISEGDLSPQELRSQLIELNQDLRSIYESMREKSLNSNDDSHYLIGNSSINLKDPIQDLLYEVYDLTLKRDFPGFETITTYISPDFQPLEKCNLNLEQKRSLCKFLEEALCNVGKHAIGATRLDVVCTKEQGRYSLRVIDNGVGITSSSNSTIGQLAKRGTRQGHEIARQLGGRFRRLSHAPQGTICELRWPESRLWLKRFW